MKEQFVRCPHCRMPHPVGEVVCPNTGMVLSNEPSAMPPTRTIADPLRRRALRAEVGPPQEELPAPLVIDLPPVGPQNFAQTREVNRSLIGHRVGGRYLVKRVLGEGGMGTVYEGEHEGLARRVAIKVLNPLQARKKVAVKRFQQEARAAGSIGHRNICEVYDMGLLDDGSPYLVMEKLVGMTLADRIANEGPLPFDDVLDVLMQVLSGLTAAHEKNIVHRDIKPDNIFLVARPDGAQAVKILDFGVSKVIARGGNTRESDLDLTRAGMVMGTPYYMSPEQARGERDLDARVDVFACGVVMYEALTGLRPYNAPNYNALLLQIISTAPVPARQFRPDLPPGFDAVIARAMASSRDERYRSASAFQRELLALRTARAGVPPPPTREERERAEHLGHVPESVRPPPSRPAPPPSSVRPPPPPPARPLAARPPQPLIPADEADTGEDLETRLIRRPQIVRQPVGDWDGETEVMPPSVRDEAFGKKPAADSGTQVYKPVPRPRDPTRK